MNSEEFESRHRKREKRRQERAERHARRHKKRHRREAEARKERVLHTRISEQLSEDIRKVADELRVPVSNLVRNVLEEAFSVVETVSENMGDLLEEIFDEAETARSRFRGRRHDWGDRADDVDLAEDAELGDDDAEAPRADVAGPPPHAGVAGPPPTSRRDFPEVLGWHPLLLNREARCADCGSPLVRGRQAFVGVTEAGLSSTLLCASCSEARHQD